MPSKTIAIPCFTSTGLAVDTREYTDAEFIAACTQELRNDDPALLVAKAIGLATERLRELKALTPRQLEDALRPETAQERADRALKNKRPAEMTDAEALQHRAGELKQENPTWTTAKILAEARKFMFETQKQRVQERKEAVRPNQADAEAESLRRKVKELQAKDPNLTTANALQQAQKEAQK